MQPSTDDSSNTSSMATDDLLDTDDLSCIDESQDIAPHVKPKPSPVNSDEKKENIKKVKTQEVLDEEWIRAYALAPWRSIYNKNTFILPVRGSIIMLKVENVRERRYSTRSNIPNTCTIYGKVIDVERIGSESIVVKGLYIENIKNKSEKLIRIDELKYSRFGGKSNLWRVICTPDKTLIKNTISSKMITDLRAIDVNYDLPTRTVDTKEEPLAFVEKHHQIPIDDCVCLRCHGAEDIHPRFGEMIICDICNGGWHTKCVENDGRNSFEVFDDWICPACAVDWNPEKIDEKMKSIRMQKNKKNKKKKKISGKNPDAKKTDVKVN